MTNSLRPRRQSKKRASKRRRATPAAFPNLETLLPPEWRRSPAWKHFRAARLEFLSGVQILLKDAVERLRSEREQDRELQRIEVEK